MIKIFVWLLFRGRLPVKDKLVRLNLLSAQLNICPFCGEFEKDICHLFIHCKRISPIQYMMASFWDVSIMCLWSTPVFFENWYHIHLPSRSMLAWRLAFYTLPWLIWNVGTVSSSIKNFSTALGDNTLTITDIRRCPSSITSPPQQTTTHYHISWIPPLVSMIKINMNGSLMNTSNQGGIGGIFRDDQGSHLLHFGKQVVTESTIYVEILAIREGFLVAAVSHQSNCAYFIFKLNSSNAVIWFSDLSRAPWRFQNVIQEALTKFSHSIQWSIIRIHLSGNKTVVDSNLLVFI